MKTRLLQSVFFCFLFLAFTSCVSKKKYAQLETEKASVVSAKDKEIIRLNKDNDSLKVEIEKMDSTILALKTRAVEYESKNEKPKSSVKKTNTLPKGTEYERKSQFLYNFAAYIEWPVIYNGTEFVVGVAAEKDVITKIQKTLGDKKVNGKKIKVEKYNKVTNYHIVYVTSAFADEFQNIKNQSKKNKTVVITDDDVLINSGAHIAFINDDEKIKYTINKPSIEKIGLKVSMELMRFSE